jgi:uncharacterized protein YigE (DUF2233 family)
LPLGAAMLQIMAMRPRSLLLCIAILFCLASALQAKAEPCREQSFKGAAYIVCSFDPAQENLRMFWRGGDGAPYRTFAALAADLNKTGRSLRFAINGGMYDDDLAPVGLYIENGRTLVPANTKTVSGAPGQIPNFYKKPNGVFYLGGGKAGILETGRFLAATPKADYASQSGPMLVIDGKLHPAFIVNSTDRKPRSGVGIARGTSVHFAISKSWVNFHDFASFFRDALGCGDALFLDGGFAAGLYAPELGRNDPPGHGGYGPIIAVVE